MRQEEQCEATGCKRESVGQLAVGLGRHYCRDHRTLLLSEDALATREALRRIIADRVFDCRSPAGREDR